ncbi:MULTISPECIES: tRNA (adenosine(37)-N6)-threonylcarbamoyltransferase complex ATPase subunit type 1 TsaE [Helicobacter]|uniref:tRNA (adenosine(37)-N6)-threonylcarbamoyltransferase complex ATPase subunit type 1 TsaE n=1 Tax=Helicobacter TaxID=209 RepID=UPI00051D193A|nr:tRNA (adenosine(37)-N6)-threonylcarbamoyltransferase complex ATPase subunit type 1 TsaE [Helicobacter sp. MIT 03-1616]TLD87650.1 tRNA (adenosine(37)-N6)-threonylcarbamoyltransferase complex ATPase subunit type 1 TsaE [Helicobacter sp. MIT 03-1616]
MDRFVLQENELNILCELLKKTLHIGSIVLLQGDIGSGKTTLVRSFIESFGTDSIVGSPTFSLVLSYENAQYGSIYHYDMYRKTLQDMLELGLLDMLMNEGVHFVEWGEENLHQLLAQNGFSVSRIAITSNENNRIYEVSL